MKSESHYLFGMLAVLFGQWGLVYLVQIAATVRSHLRERRWDQFAPQCDPPAMLVAGRCAEAMLHINRHPIRKAVTCRDRPRRREGRRVRLKSRRPIAARPRFRRTHNCEPQLDAEQGQSTFTSHTDVDQRWKRGSAPSNV